jgi:hypothetical protein
VGLPSLTPCEREGEAGGALGAGAGAPSTGPRPAAASQPAAEASASAPAAAAAAAVPARSRRVAVVGSARAAGSPLPLASHAPAAPASAPTVAPESAAAAPTAAASSWPASSAFGPARPGAALPVASYTRPPAPPAPFVPEQPPAKPSECFAQSDGGDYRGAVAQAFNGKPCLNWFVHNASEVRRYGHAAGLGDHGLCRRPYGFACAWCHVEPEARHPTRTWECCDIGEPDPYWCRADARGARLQVEGAPATGAAARGGADGAPPSTGPATPSLEQRMPGLAALIAALAGAFAVGRALLTCRRAPGEAAAVSASDGAAPPPFRAMI